MDPPNVKSIRPGVGRVLIVTWKNGTESPVDVSEHLEAYPLFVTLRDTDEAFHRVRVGEWGWNAHWTDDMEISADTLWRLALEQGAHWLRAWRDAHRMTQAEAAAALGLSLRMLRHYETGEYLLPKTVRLACAGFDAQAEAA